MEWRERSLLMRLLTMLMSTVAPITGVFAQDYGKVGAVNPDATSVAPGGSVRTLTVGANVVYKERIQTSSQGTTQILFPDQSTVNIGPNTSLVLDEFYYDPNARTGSMTTTLTKGALRYIGGMVSHNSGVNVNTPVANIGIRGGIVTVMLPVPPSIVASDPRLAGQGQLVIAHHGAITLTNGAGTITLRPGFAVIVNSANQPISAPFRPSDATLRLIVQSLSSRPGQSGGIGRANVPNNNTFGGPGNRLGTPGAPGNNPQGNSQQGSNRPAGADPFGYTSIFGAGNAAGSGRSQSQQTQTGPRPYP